MSTTAELQAANEQLRSAVEGRHVQAAEAACCEGGQQWQYTEDETIPPDWILRGEQELKQRELPPVRLIGDSLLASDETSPAEQLLEQAIGVVRDRRPKYGGPLAHFAKTVGLINAAFGDVLKRPLTPADWAIIMTLDKIARDRGPTPTDDTPIDIAGYAACLAECRHTA